MSADFNCERKWPTFVQETPPSLFLRNREYCRRISQSTIEQEAAGDVGSFILLRGETFQPSSTGEGRRAGTANYHTTRSNAGAYLRAALSGRWREYQSRTHLPAQKGHRKKLLRADIEFQNPPIDIRFSIDREVATSALGRKKSAVTVKDPLNGTPLQLRSGRSEKRLKASQGQPAL